MKRLIRCVLALLAVTQDTRALACSILNVTTPETVIVGRNHDWFDEARSGPMRLEYRLEFVPASAGKRGAFYSTGVLSGFHIAFEGMNDRGLFVGLTATPRIPMKLEPTKLRVDSSRLVQLLLETSATVEEAVAEAGKYALDDPSYVPSSHFMVVDPEGRSVVLEFTEEGLRVIPKRGTHQHMTNAYLSSVTPPVVPPWAADGRYATIGRLLEAGGGATVEDAFSVLHSVVMSEASMATQTMTVYDLRRRTVTAASDRRFDRRVTFELDRELAKGLHTVVTRTLAEAPSSRALRWALDGEVIASNDGELYRVAGGDAPDVQLTALAGDVSVSCGLDGRIAFSRILKIDWYKFQHWKTAVFTMNTDGSGLRKLTDGSSNDIVAIWPRNRSGRLYVVRYTPSGRWEVEETRVEATPGQERTVSDYYQSERAFAVLTDGRLIVESDREPGRTALERPLFLLTPRRGDAKARYEPIDVRFPVQGRFDKLALSPDETQVLFEIGVGEAQPQGKGQVSYVARFDRKALTLSDPVALGAPRDNVWFPRWGPGGKAVYFLSNRTGKNQLYRYVLETRTATRVTLDDAVPRESFCFPGVVN